MLLEQNRTRFLFHFGVRWIFFHSLVVSIGIFCGKSKNDHKIIESESNLVFFSSDFWYDLQKD